MLKDIAFRRFLELPLASKAALITACCCFFVALILIGASERGNQQLIQRSSELFGESLAEQLARDASNPLVKGDKLSLQSQLNKLVESPLIVAAVIYDIQNHPVAEAGQKNSRGQSLSASITFQDSIAGYAILTLDTTSLTNQLSHNRWWLVALALLLSVLAYYLSFLPARYVSAAIKDLQVLGNTKQSLRNTHRQIAYQGEDELQQLARTLISGLVPAPAESDDLPRQTAVNPSEEQVLNLSTSRAILAVTLCNLPTLRQQCSKAHIDQLLDDLYQQLQKICKLYEGELSINRDNGFCLSFAAVNDDQSYPFRAVCSGHLLTQWRNQEAGALLIAAGLAVYESEVQSGVTASEQAWLEQAAISQAYSMAGSAQQLYADCDIVNHGSVKPRVEWQANSAAGQATNISRLAAPYHELLQRQLSSLQKSGAS